MKWVELILESQTFLISFFLLKRYDLLIMQSRFDARHEQMCSLLAGVLTLGRRSNMVQDCPGSMMLSALSEMGITATSVGRHRSSHLWLAKLSVDKERLAILGTVAISLVVLGILRSVTSFILVAVSNEEGSPGQSGTTEPRSWRAECLIEG